MVKRENVTVAKSPCKSCPYRRDVPSAVWASHEYEKLPEYDGSVVDQLERGTVAMFDCHQRTGELCAGWVGCHGPSNLLALMLNVNRVAPEVWEYQSPVPLFASGREACEHGLRDIEKPSGRAHRMMLRLMRKLRGVRR